MPESARWLVLSGAEQSAARKALVATKGNIDDLDTVVDSEIKDMQAAAADGKSGAFDFSKLLKKKNIQPLYIGLSLMFFQQITGQPSVLYYAAKIFQDAGFTGEGAATGTGSLKTQFLRFSMNAMALLGFLLLVFEFIS